MTQEPVQEGYSLIRLSSLVGLCVPYIVARSLRLACTLLFSGRCTAPSARLQIERAGILGSDSPSFPDSQECVEGNFLELRNNGVLRSSLSHLPLYSIRASNLYSIRANNLYSIRANNKSPIGAIRSLGSTSMVQSSRSQED